MVDPAVRQHDQVGSGVIGGHFVVGNVANVGHAMAAQAQPVDLRLVVREVLAPRLAGDQQPQVGHVSHDRRGRLNQQIEPLDLLDLPEEQQHACGARKAQLRPGQLGRRHSADMPQVVAVRDHVDLALGNAQHAHQLALAHPVVRDDAVGQAVHHRLDARPLAAKRLDVVRGDDDAQPQQPGEKHVEEFERADLKHVKVRQPVAATPRTDQRTQAARKVPQPAPPGRVGAEDAPVDPLHLERQPGARLRLVAGVERGRDIRAQQPLAQTEVVVVHAAVATDRLDDRYASAAAARDGRHDGCHEGALERRQRESALHALVVGFEQRRLGVARHFNESRCQRGGVTAREQPVRRQRVGHAVDGRGDDWPAEMHRFEHDQRNAFVARRNHERVDGGIDRRQVTGPRRKHHAARDTLVDCQLLEHRQVRPVPDHEQLQIGQLLTRQLERLDGQVVALLPELDTANHCNDPVPLSQAERRAGCQPVDVAQALEVDAVRHHRHGLLHPPALEVALHPRADGDVLVRQPVVDAVQPVSHERLECRRAEQAFWVGHGDVAERWHAESFARQQARAAHRDATLRNHKNIRRIGRHGSSNRADRTP